MVSDLGNRISFVLVSSRTPSVNVPLSSTAILSLARPVDWVLICVMIVPIFPPEASLVIFHPYTYLQHKP